MKDKVVLTSLAAVVLVWVLYVALSLWLCNAKGGVSVLGTTGAVCLNRGVLL